MAKNLSKSSLDKVRREGCIIVRHIDKELVECKAVQDGMIFICPKNLLVSKHGLTQKTKELYTEACRRCGCGISTCDEEAVTIRKCLQEMNVDVPVHKRVLDVKKAQRYVKHLREGKDVRLSIRHYITWPGNSPAPIVSDHPTSSEVEMKEVKRKCIMSQSTCSVPQKKTRLRKSCPECIKLQVQLTTSSEEMIRITNEYKNELEKLMKKFQKEKERYENKIKLLEGELIVEKKNAVIARGGRHGDVKTCVYAAVLSGIQYWQFRRFFQITGILGLCDHKKWDNLVTKLYDSVTGIMDWSTKFIIGFINEKIGTAGRSCAADVRWSHVGAHGKHCTGVVVDMETDAIVARVHLSKDKNTHDFTMKIWTSSSGAMEVQCLDLNFKKLKGQSYEINHCSFDGDSEAKKALFSYYHYATATRDPSHQGKNCYKMLKRVFKLFKYNCDCPFRISDATGKKIKDSSGRFLRNHNYLKEAMMKTFGSRISYILMNNKSCAMATRKIKGAIKHMFGKCNWETDGCTHGADYVNPNPVNCPMMKQAIEKYMVNDVLRIVMQTIVEGVGAISTNTCESIMSMIKEMVGKKRFCHILLYVVRADVALLSKNQKFFTKQFIQGKIPVHHHWLVEVLRKLDIKVSDVQANAWRKEETQKLKQDAKQKTSAVKLTRIKKKKSKYKTLQQEKKKSASGMTYSYESGGGARTLAEARDKRELRASREELRHSAAQEETLKTWSQNDPRIFKLKQNQIKLYLETRISKEALSQLPERKTGWLKTWREALSQYVQSQPGETIKVPSEWDSITSTPERRQQPEEVTNTPITWKKDDARLHALKEKQIKDYLVDKIAVEKFRDLDTSDKKGRLQRWRELLQTFVATLPGDTILVPGIWANVRALKSKRGGIDTELDLSDFTVLKVYCDLETTGLSIYTANILSIGMIFYLEDERLGQFESYVHNKTDFPMTSTDVHGIYPIAAPHPNKEISKLVDAPTLTQMNENALAFLNRQKELVQARVGSTQEVVLHLITWNGNMFDVPMWVLCTDENANKPGQWRDTFGKVILAFSDYKLVTQNIGITPTEEQRKKWEEDNAEKLQAGKRVSKTWKPTQKLGEFHKTYCGRPIVGAHQVLPDTQALYDVEAECKELKDKRNAWRQVKHLAKPLDDILQRIANNARAYGPKHGHTYSRPPYGKERPVCRHKYPCSVYVSNEEKVVNFRCNSDFNGKIRDKETGEDRRCSFRMTEAEWNTELSCRENMALAIELEGGGGRGLQETVVASIAL